MTAPPTGQCTEPRGDALLIERSRDEPERFGEIFDACFTEIHRYVARRLDAATAYVAFRRRDRFDLSRDSARPWLYGITTN